MPTRGTRLNLSPFFIEPDDWFFDDGGFEFPSEKIWIKNEQKPSKEPFTLVLDMPFLDEDSIKLVAFNKEKGVTVIKWNDGTITKVKAQADKGDSYDPEKGMAMCICKKMFGNTGWYNEVFKKWLPDDEESGDSNA